MNAGFGNLAGLKGQLLAPALRAQTTYDGTIAALGLGVAGRFEQFCNRKFGRVVEDVAIFSADRDHYVVPRYPLEAVMKVEQRDDMTAGWYELSGVVIQVSESSGLVQFIAELGSRFSRVRMTYTGGYWWETEEAGETARPEGAAVLPDDLQLAWVLQCRAIWASMDKTGAGMAQSAGPGSAFDIRKSELLEEVKQILGKYVRYQMS